MVECLTFHFEFSQKERANSSLMCVNGLGCPGPKQTMIPYQLKVVRWDMWPKMGRKLKTSWLTLHSIPMCWVSVPNSKSLKACLSHLFWILWKSSPSRKLIGRVAGRRRRSLWVCRMIFSVPWMSNGKTGYPMRVDWILESLFWSNWAHWRWKKLLEVRVSLLPKCMSCTLCE